MERPSPRSLRIGIDVGGTFTDVVAIDAQTRALIATVKVATTHDAAAGVANGVVAGIEQLLRDRAIDAGEVSFIAHSTTQATNALLEGDLARVGVLGLLDRLGWLSRRQMRFGAVALDAGRTFAPEFAFAKAKDDAMRAAVDGLVARGAEAIAASESFAVDRPACEDAAVEYARSLGVEATSGHDVSSAYGLRARTRTAALNAAILPKMVRTARVTAAAVERAAIPAPLMVMRSDGGVMNVHEVERRPILTLLSGPAAGIAGALLYERLSDGIFIEVGGTSSDCSVIRAGRPQMHPARVGGHRTMLRTLDVRTLGIGGGSLLRIEGNTIVDVGARSAHIAGCAYASFVAPETLEGARVESLTVSAEERAAYVVLIARDGRRIAPTVTCAANLAGIVPRDAFAQGNVDSARRAFALLGRHLGGEPLELAQRVLTLAAGRVRGAIEQLIAEYELDRATVVLIGGGGAAGALLPAVAGSMQLPYRIARDAEVIAPIGVALALVRDEIERTLVAPTPYEIAMIRRDAADRVVAAGAAPERVEVEIEIDTQRNRVRATASGAMALTDSIGSITICGEDERREAAAQSLRCDPSELAGVELTRSLTYYERPAAVDGRRRREGKIHDGRVVDDRGAIRLAVRDPRLVRTTVAALEQCARDAIEGATRFGDVGRALPAVYLLRAARIAAFEGLSSAEQAVALIAEETEGCAPDETAALLLVARQA